MAGTSPQVDARRGGGGVFGSMVLEGQNQKKEQPEGSIGTLSAGSGWQNGRERTGEEAAETSMRSRDSGSKRGDGEQVKGGKSVSAGTSGGFRKYSVLSRCTGNPIPEEKG